MVKIAIDVMGGDYAPLEILKAVVLSLKAIPDLQIYLYGQEDVINVLLKNIIKDNYVSNIEKRLKIIHTKYFLEMGVDNLREQFRNNPNASMFLALQAAKNNEVDGVISAGPTQALIFASHLLIKKNIFMKRLALAPLYNSFDQRTRILLDAGANIALKSEDLLSFAIYATVIAQELLNISKPQVKILNIGIEKTKGRDLELQTYNLLEKNPNIYFGGNEEPQNLLTSSADILLSDGFTSNIALKTYEGVIKNLNKQFKQVLTSNIFTKIISKFCFQKKLKNMAKQIDPNEIGGAMILGLNKIIIKAHGSSKSHSFYKAILQGEKLIKSNIINKVSKKLNIEKK